LKDYSDIFGTCSGGEITIWKTKTLAPALRISLAKTTCISLHFPKNGKYIISGWSDDSIRIFSPQNGKIIHRITPCNLQKVV
jgi:WD40 repeat protein